MIGRFGHPGKFRELLMLKEFYLTAAGAALIGASYLFAHVVHAHLLAPLCAVLAVLVLGGPIIWGAITGLLARKSNVDELVSLAMLAAVLIGEYLSAAVVALIMIVGSLLEKYTAQRARSAIHALLQLSPTDVCVVRDGHEQPIPQEEVVIGDAVIVRPGERIAVDGTVMRGSASVNQASLTGESMPVEKHSGDPVYAGTTIVTGMLCVSTQRVGADTSLGRLIRLVHDAEQSRAPILRVADRFAQYFTPAIILLGVGVYAFTGDIHRAITVLIVGCPCAFILAAPTAVTAALGNAARNGVLIKAGALLEEIGRISAVVFDKTGTLTTGQPTVVRTVPAAGYTEHEVLSWAGSAETYSEHPVAQAICRAATTAQCPRMEPVDFQQLPGQGITATVLHRQVFVGTTTDMLPTAWADLQGVTRLVVQLDHQPIGYLAIADTLRPEAQQVIPRLGELGIPNIALLTGDQAEAARHIARQCGIQDVHAGVLPEHKLERIRLLQQQGLKVAMVGDGINDAPSLVAADIGIAMGAMGTDVAIESADVALMTDDLAKIPYMLALGKKTIRTINHNIAFALMFNVLALIASSLGYLTPVLGAVTHNIGSVLVVVNSALLLRRG